MGRFTKLEIPKEFIDYSERLPENLLLAAINKIDEGVANNDALAEALTKNLNIKVAPGEQFQRDYKTLTDDYVSRKNKIVDDMMSDKLNYSKYKSQLSKLTSDIQEQLSFGKLKALKEHGEDYYTKLAGYQSAYKDNPELYEYAKKQLNEGLPKNIYNQDLNTYGAVADAKMVKYISSEDIEKTIQGRLKSIEEESGMSREELIKLVQTPFQTAYDFPEAAKKTYEKVRDVLRGMPKEIIDSLNQSHKAKGDFTTDENTFYDEVSGAFNPNTELGKILNSYATAGTYSKGHQFTLTSGVPKSSGSGGSGSGTEIKTADHVWHTAYSQLKTLWDRALEARNLGDMTTYHAHINAYVNAFKKNIADLIDVNGTLKYTQMYRDNPSNIKLFAKGALNQKDGKPNPFEPEDFIIDAERNVAYVYFPKNPNLATKPDLIKSALNRNIKYKKLANGLTVEYQTINLNNKEQKDNLINGLYILATSQLITPPQYETPSIEQAKKDDDF